MAKQETETLDKLYLEWSQFTTARTKQETLLEGHLRGLIECLDDYLEFNSDSTPIYPGSLVHTEARQKAENARQFLRDTMPRIH